MTPTSESLKGLLFHGGMAQLGAFPLWLPMRTLDSSHRESVRNHLLSLNAADRLLRFCHAVSDEEILRYVAHIDFLHDVVFGVFDRRLRLAAMAHLAFAHDGLEAEFGVSVLEHLRGRGFGRRLFDHTVMHARNRGVSTMVIHLAHENLPMLAIVRGAGATVNLDGPEVTAQLPLLGDTLGTQMGAMVERHAAEFDYQLKLHVLRLDRLWGQTSSAGQTLQG